MNRRIHTVLMALALVLTGSVAQVSAAQMDAPDACCLADEWRIVLEEPVAQTDGEFCCIANEWQAEPGLSGDEAAERAAQSANGIANEWDAS